MTSTVMVKMNTCGKTHRVTASLRPDGIIDIRIESDCPNVEQYARNLTEITSEDAVSFAGSRIVDPEIRGPLSAPCLCPNAVFDAAWMELGLLSKGLCSKVHSNELVLDCDSPDNRIIY